MILLLGIARELAGAYGLVGTAFEVGGANQLRLGLATKCQGGIHAWDKQ